MKCPICDAELELIYDDYLDGHILLEEHYKCSSEHPTHYTYDYEYGSILEKIGSEEILSHYTDSEEISKRNAEKFSELVEKEKERLGLNNA